jgi:hypothetical protein
MNKNHTPDDTYRTTPVNDEYKPYTRRHIQNNTSKRWIKTIHQTTHTCLVYGFYSSFTDVVLYVSSDIWFLFIVYWCFSVCVIWCMVFIHRLLVLFCMCRLVYGFSSSFTDVVLYVSSDVWFLFIAYWCCSVCVVWCMVFIHRLLVLSCMCRLMYGFYSSFTGVVLYVDTYRTTPVNDE